MDDEQLKQYESELLKAQFKHDRPLVVIFILLCIAGGLFWIVSFVTGGFNDMMKGIGVEILGAIITALGVLGLERIYAHPDPQVGVLTKIMKQQSEKIDSLQTQLETLVAQLTPASPTAETLDVPPISEDEANDSSV